MKGSKKAAVLVLSVVLVAMTLLASCGGSQTGEASWPAMESLKEVDSSGITRISFEHSTEAGAVSNTVYDAGTIEEIYLRLVNVSIGAKTDAGVDDDSLKITVDTEDKSMSFSFEGNLLVLEDGSSYEVENLDKLKIYIDELAAEIEAANSDGSVAGSQDSGVSSADYDMTDGMQTVASSDGSIEYIYFNDFMMVMPNNEKWSMETSPRAVTFYLFSAQQEGYGGKLVSIAAYDLDDDTYTHLPSYHEAGITTNSNVRLIAEYPTDVQWNHDDPTQEADYKDLYEYLQKIGAGAVNSPLQTGDSD